jgi:hypothetical protein
VESEVAQAAEANAVVPGLLQHQEALAQGQPQTPRRRARKDGQVTGLALKLRAHTRSTSHVSTMPVRLGLF